MGDLLKSIKMNKNLWIDKWQIPVALKMLCHDFLFWVKNKTYYPEEIAIWFLLEYSSEMHYLKQ
jgi:hypothetical protein